MLAMLNFESRSTSIKNTGVVQDFPVFVLIPTSNPNAV